MGEDGTNEKTQIQVGSPTVGMPSLVIALPKIANFEITREIARGGMGVVYEAKQIGLNRVVAIKMLPREGQDNANSIQRFLTEARAAAKVIDPHVVDIYDYGSVDNSPYLAMEYLPGGSLAKRIKSAEVYSPIDAATLLQKIASGVGAAHTLNIVHRDIKPDNVLFAENGEPKVADFGLAKEYHPDGTVTQVVQGTPKYMSPEQAKGDGTPIGPPSDVWALGVILYELLTSRCPFDSPSAHSTIRKVIDEPPPPFQTIRRDGVIPADLQTICLKCLQKKPEKRYATANELADDLGRYISGQKIVAKIEISKPSRKKWYAIAGVILVLGSVIFGVAKWNRPATVPTSDLSRREEVNRRVDSLFRSTPQPDRESPHKTTKVDKLEPPDRTAFRDLEDERIIDMRGWKPIRPEMTEDIDTADCSVVMRLRLRLLKIAKTDTLKIESRTSGKRLAMRCVTPNPERASMELAEQTGFVGQQAMKIRQLAVDVGNIDVDQEFEVRMNTTFWSSLQKPDERWFGAIGYEGSLKTSMLLLFPSDKPFKSYRLRVAPTRQSDPVPYEGPGTIFADENKLWLFWEVPIPKAGSVYRIDWDW